MNERAALEEMVNVAVEFSHDADHIMNAVDELVAAKRLDEHVMTCQQYKLVEEPGLVYHDYNKPCGRDKWYCDRAPIKERS